MKTLVSLSIWAFSLALSAQQPLDTIYANDKKNVALFFPNTIRQGITGTPNFIFSYNREKEEYFGLLQAKPGHDSNLLVVTSNGQLFSYILKYQPKLSKLNYFIADNESIGNLIPKKINTDSTDPVGVSENRTLEEFSSTCRYLLKSTTPNIASKRKKGISIKLFEPYYAGSEVFLKLEVKNRSGIDFEIDYLSVFKTNGANKPKASFQYVPIDTKFALGRPKIFKAGQKHRFVYVFPKFVLGDTEKLLIELKELNGSRKLALETTLH